LVRQNAYHEGVVTQTVKGGGEKVLLDATVAWRVGVDAHHEGGRSWRDPTERSQNKKI